jgi:pre-mRNA splicing factor component
MNLDNDVPLSEEDAAERDERLRRRQEEAERLALAQRSQVVRLGLPRLPQIDPEQLLQTLDDRQDQAQFLIDQEMVQLMLHDSIAHPLPGTSLPGGTESQYTIPPADEIAAALSEIHLELAQSLGFPELDYESFSRLRTNESATGPRRVAALREEVEKLERRESLLQSRYAELDTERKEAQERLAVLEEKIMAEAEALNDSYLDAEE